jgi:hypothetical protein
MAYHGLGRASLGTALPGASVTVLEIAEDVCRAGVRSLAICAVVIARRNGHTQVVDASKPTIGTVKVSRPAIRPTRPTIAEPSFVST